MPLGLYFGKGVDGTVERAITVEGVGITGNLLPECY